MKTINKFLCRIFGHNYYVIEEFSPTVRRIGCSRCGKEWGMHDEIKCLVEWDEELAEATIAAYPYKQDSM